MKTNNSNSLSYFDKYNSRKKISSSIYEEEEEESSLKSKPAPSINREKAAENLAKKSEENEARLRRENEAREASEREEAEKRESEERKEAEKRETHEREEAETRDSKERQNELKQETELIEHSEKKDSKERGRAMKEEEDLIHGFESKGAGESGHFGKHGGGVIEPSSNHINSDTHKRSSGTPFAQTIILQEHHQKALGALIVFFLLCAVVIAAIGPSKVYNYFYSGQAIADLELGMQNLKANQDKYSPVKTFNEYMDRQMKIAKGELDPSVEEKTQEKIGFFIEQIVPSAPIFYTTLDKEIVSYAEISAKGFHIIDCKDASSDSFYTLFSNPTEKCIQSQTVNFNCRFGTTTEPLIEKAGSPEKMDMYLMQGKENIDCIVPISEIPSLTTYKLKLIPLTLKASFSFQTMTQLETYLMDVYRKREESKQFDIPAKYNLVRNPSSISTAGPIRLAIGGTHFIDDIPFGISPDQGPISTSIGITIENTGEGKVKKLNSLTIILPVGMTLENNNCMGVDFSTGGDVDSMNNNEYFAKAPEVTITEQDSTKSTDKVTSSTLVTQADIDEQANSATSGAVSGSFFLRSIGPKQLLTLRCRIIIDPTILKDAGAVKTVRLAALAEYDYELEKSTVIKIEKDKDLIMSNLNNQDEICEDVDGCICQPDGKVKDVLFGTNCKGESRDTYAKRIYSVIDTFKKSLFSCNELCKDADGCTCNTNCQNTEIARDQKCGVTTTTTTTLPDSDNLEGYDNQKTEFNDCNEYCNDKDGCICPDFCEHSSLIPYKGNCGTYMD